MKLSCFQYVILETDGSIRDGSEHPTVPCGKCACCSMIRRKATERVRKYRSKFKDNK